MKGSEYASQIDFDHELLDNQEEMPSSLLNVDLDEGEENKEETKKPKSLRRLSANIQY